MIKVRPCRCKTTSPDPFSHLDDLRDSPLDGSPNKASRVRCDLFAIEGYRTANVRKTAAKIGSVLHFTHAPQASKNTTAIIPTPSITQVKSPFVPPIFWSSSHDGAPYLCSSERHHALRIVPDCNNLNFLRPDSTAETTRRQKPVTRQKVVRASHPSKSVSSSACHTSYTGTTIRTSASRNSILAITRTQSPRNADEGRAGDGLPGESGD